MTIEQERRSRTVNFVVVVALLVLLVVGLAVLFAVTAQGAGKDASPAIQKYLARLAGLSMALLATTLLLLAWVVARHVLSRLRPEGHPPTPYVDAWALAGKRLRLKAEPKEGEGGEDEGKA
jgi:heme/copper-type cytochrome/quinol oxidase subunit 2